MRHITRPAVPLLRFLGATDTVTGSRFLVDTPHARVLIDCGLFQGLKALRLRNWKPFPVAPETIDAVRADARTSRPHGLPAGPGPPRFPGTHFCHGGNPRPLPDRVTRQRAPPGGRRGVRESQRLLETRAGAATSGSACRIRAIPSSWLAFRRRARVAAHSSTAPGP
jgi:hypothetical protein